MSRTLIVEDDRLSGRALSRLLTFTGHESSWATTLSEAVKKLDERPGTVLLDMALPDGSGLNLLAQIRNAHLPVKVAVTTAESDSALMARVRALKPEQVFRKPLNIPAVLDWLSTTTPGQA